ncbi:MAG: hypothetical protein Q9210_005303 [Variospora velana]
MPPEMRVTPFATPMDSGIQPQLSSRPHRPGRPSDDRPSYRYYAFPTGRPEMTNPHPLDQTSNKKQSVDPHCSVTMASGSNIRRDTNNFYISSRSVRFTDRPEEHGQGSFALVPGEESSSSARVEESRTMQRGRPPLRRFLRSTLSLHLLWIFPVLWPLFVALLRYQSGGMVSNPQEMDLAPVDGTFAPTLLIQNTIEAALINTHGPHAAKLDALSKQAAIDRQQTILSREHYSSAVHNCSATGDVQITAIASRHSTRLDKTIDTILFYFWPWGRTSSHRTRFALARATHLHDRVLPALDAFSTYFSGNLSQWIETMGQISDVIATEHEAHAGELYQLGKDPVAYIRETYHAHDSWKTTELSMTLGGLVCRMLKVLVPALERAQAAKTAMLAFQGKLGEARERCMIGKKGGCDESSGLLERLPQLAPAR